MFLKNFLGSENHSGARLNCADKCGGAMGFPHILAAFGDGSDGQGLMQQPILPKIPKEVLWFILHLKVLEIRRWQGIRNKRVGRVL